MTDFLASGTLKDGSFVVLEDPDPEDPRSWENITTLVCWHRKYTLGDEQPSVSPAEYANTLVEKLPTDLQEVAAKSDSLRSRIVADNFEICQLYMYEHTGILLSLTPFSCPWDSGRLGFVVAQKQRVLEMTSANDVDWRDVAKEQAALEVGIYSAYVAGEVYELVQFSTKRPPVDYDDYSVYCDQSLVVDRGTFYGYDSLQRWLTEQRAPE